MKKIKIVTVLFIVMSAFSMISCTSDVEPIDPTVDLGPTGSTGTTGTTGTTGQTGTFKVDFNGQTFETQQAKAVIKEGKITIEAPKGTQGERFGILLEGTTVGTYDTLGKVLAVYTANNTDNSGYSSLDMTTINYVNTASVTITSINQITHLILGTFHFKGVWNNEDTVNPPNPIDFINGTFEIPYTIESDPVASGTFKVDIDGAAFVANSIIATKTFVKDANNQPVINPDTNLPTVIYSITGKYNETKIVVVQFIELNSNTYTIPTSGGAAITYYPTAIDPLNFFTSSNPDSDNPIGNIIITSNNDTTHVISGTFKSKIYLLDMTTLEVTETKELSNGQFSNITYTIH